MKQVILSLSMFLAVGTAAIYVSQPGANGETCYTGMCDASAVVSLNEEYFAVADDEQSVIRVYSRHQGGAPAHLLNVAPFLGLPRKAAEVDIEGAARLGQHVFWISSHGCNAAGKEQPSRRRFFATTGSVTNGRIDFQPVGRPYSALLQDLASDPRLAQFDLAAAARRVPKSPDALNIEGLCATPDGNLLIGFRNPIPQGKALLVPLLNPVALISGTDRAKFGEPVLLDLDGLGIRSISFRNDRYWIVAGSYDGGGRSRLYEWFGGEDMPRPMAVPEFAELNPEAITFFEDADGTHLWAGSDDGTRKINGVDCKRLKDPRQKQFRAVTVPL
ncbi:MAG: DUF3616 domain-containing protein [Verrucomicrobia bacterium]|nr:DUF3616 domain-containing protein [Verrucomicrobiota bacterium]